MQPASRPSRSRLERHDEGGNPIYRHGAPTFGRGHMQTARHFIAARRVTKANRNPSLRRRSPRILRTIMAAVAPAALAMYVLLFASSMFAQPVADALGELLVGKAAFGDWRTDAPLVRRKITELPPPYATRSASNPQKPVSAAPNVPPGFQVELFAFNLRDPRAVRVAPNGDIFIAESERGGFGSCAPPRGLPSPAATTCSPQASTS